jgi:iron only hydrogenase large subunit-like protein
VRCYISGCVTSAETVLIQEQSYSKLLDKLASGDGSVVVVAISPQSRASIAGFIADQGAEMSPVEAFLKIASALKALGVYYVIDTASAGDVALVEAREEFLHRC